MPPKPPPTVPPMKCSRDGRRVQHLGRGAQREEQRLRGGVADIAAVLFGRGDGAAGLHRRLLDGRHLVAALDHVVGLAEGGLHIAVAELLVVVLAVIDELVGRDRCRARSARRALPPPRRRGRAAAAPNPPALLHGGARLRLGLGDDGGDGLALVAHFARSTGSVRRRCPKSSSDSSVLRLQRHVASQKDADDARHPLGLGHVDPADSGGVVRRAHAAQVQQAVEQVVVEERRPAGDVAEDVLPARRLADLVEVVVAARRRRDPCGTRSCRSPVMRVPSLRRRRGSRR